MYCIHHSLLILRWERWDHWTCCEIEVLSPGILKFSTKHEDHTLTLYCSKVFCSFLVIFHAGSCGLDPKNFWNLNYKKMVGLAHISRQPFCFLSIWFNLVTYCVTTPWTTEKRDLSSAKSLIVDDKPDHQHTSRSSTYIKKNKGTMIDPWEATAQTPFNRVYHITNDLILDINLSSQTLSKALRLL